jgi:hypothetical protein
METDAAHSWPVFICYAQEDDDAIANLERILSAHGIEVWRSGSSLKPGEDWAGLIRKVITEDSIAFLACFSSRSTSREKSYQNTELLIAVEEMRRRPPGSDWLIPVRLDDCQIPEFDLGGGRTLESLQRTDFYGPRCQENANRLAAKIKEISGRTTAPARAEEPAADRPPKPAWVMAYDAFERLYQVGVGWTATMLSPVAMSAVLHLGGDPRVTATYLSGVPLQKAARMLAASPPAASAEVLKLTEEQRATAILKHIPADKAQAIIEAMRAPS